jgi:hypothetical protein
MAKACNAPDLLSDVKPHHVAKYYDELTQPGDIKTLIPPWMETIRKVEDFNKMPLKL